MDEVINERRFVFFFLNHMRQNLYIFYISYDIIIWIFLFCF